MEHGTWNKKASRKSETRIDAPCSLLPAPYRGFSLVEIIIGAALILVSFVGLMTAYSFYLKVGLNSADTLKAAYMLEEGVEAITLLRDQAWANISSLGTSTEYFLLWNGAAWQTTATAQLIDGQFRRTIGISDVFRRNSDKDIVATSSSDAKTFDPNIKKITVRVATLRGVDKKLVAYIANLFE